MTQWPTEARCAKFYGPIGSGHTTIDVPYPLYYDGKLVRRIGIHKLCADSALRAMTGIRVIYSDADMKSLGISVYGGCYNPRMKRGSDTEWSMHAYACAMDFDPARNQLRWGAPQARLSHDDAIPFCEAWENEGWVSLGRERDFDWMHVQAAQL